MSVIKRTLYVDARGRLSANLLGAVRFEDIYDLEAVCALDGPASEVAAFLRFGFRLSLSDFLGEFFVRVFDFERAVVEQVAAHRPAGRSAG